MGPSLYTGGPAGAAPKGPPTLRILFVDDESMILQALQRALSRMRPTWSVDVAPGGAEALSLLSRTPVDVVVADLHMPDMDGPALLEEVRRSHPTTLRYVVSGSSADELGPVSPGLIQRFLPKPFEMRALLEALDLTEDLLGGGERGALPRMSAGTG